MHCILSMLCVISYYIVKLKFTFRQCFIIGMRAAYSFKHPLFSDSAEFCGWVCLSARFFKMLLLRHFLSN